jgi:prepilin-type N-terminal cleavage/methylation domain-containing protein
MIFPAQQFGRRMNARGVTLVEVAITVAIIAVLALLVLGGYSKYRSYAENVKCLAQMKDIGVALGNYTVTKQTWPQQPVSLENAEEEQVAEWWIKTMEEWGIAQKTWLCPTDGRYRKDDAARAGVKRADYELSYWPTDFDEGRDTPYRWKQPWLIERGDFHGSGQNFLMPDGSLVPFKNPMNQPGKK